MGDNELLQQALLGGGAPMQMAQAQVDPRQQQPGESLTQWINRIAPPQQQQAPSAPTMAPQAAPARAPLGRQPYPPDFQPNWATTGPRSNPYPGPDPYASKRGQWMGTNMDFGPKVKDLELQEEMAYQQKMRPRY